METLAYTHLALAYEELDNINPPIALGGGSCKGGMNWKKFARRAGVPLLSLALTLFGLGNSQAEAALQRGDSSAEVTDLQNQLIDSGHYDGPVTGYFGALTEGAVKRLQQAKGQAVTGIADQATFTSLQPTGNDTTDGSRLTIGNKGKYVIDLQNTLKAAGYYSGEVSGYFGEVTETAVMAFQQANGLEVDGVAGQKTLEALQDLAMATPAESAQQPENQSAEVGDRVTPTADAQQSDNPIATVTPAADAQQPDNPIATVAPAADAQQPDNQSAQGSDGAIGGNLALGAQGLAVNDLQNRLQATGYYDGTVSGSFDIVTEAAVLRFQRDQGIEVDGIAGPTTQGLLAARR